MKPEKSRIRLQVPAKLNLSLDIVGRKENGYHLLEMVMQSIGLYDEISLAVTPAERFSFAIHCSRPWIPTDKRNIVYQAAEAFFGGFGEELPDIHLEIGIEKHIPDQAGMAGGSADAAGVLAGLNRLYGCPYPEEKLREIGLTVGADVPYCLYGGTAFVSGIGEQIRALPLLERGFVAGARPKAGISTKAAYRGFDDANPGIGRLPSSPKTRAVLEAVEEGNLSAVSERMFNVFEEVCAVPEVRKLKAELLSLGAMGAMMTGSGSAVFGIFTERKKAEAAAAALEKSWPETFSASLSGSLSVLEES